MPLLQFYYIEHIVSAISCMLVQVSNALDVIYEPQKQAFPYIAHIVALESTWGNLLMWVLHVTNVLADGETNNINNNTLTRQQDKILAAKSSQQDGRQFMGSGQNI